MSKFSTKIVWKFKSFEPNTIFASGKEEKGEKITKDELSIQKELLKTKLLSRFTEVIEPFSLINPLHDLIIIDQKKITQDYIRNFKDAEDSKVSHEIDEGTKQSLISYSYSSKLTIDNLNAYLENNWKSCIKVLQNVHKSDNSTAQKLVDYLNKTR
jgi:hypothetical protein